MATSRTGPPRPALHHRLPVRLRHYWKSLTIAGIGFVALIAIFGQARVRPYITSQLTTNDEITDNIMGTGDLFDSGSHSISLSYNQSEYDDMFATFQKEGDKDFIRADITIDGTEIDDVGLRLKGNSTLSSLRGTTGRQQTGGKRGAAQPGGAGFGGMSMTSLSKDKPAELPWLISFDEFSSGRAYRGNTEITLRPAALGSSTAINEALALTLTKQAGQTTQAYTITQVSVNGGKAVPRMLVDPPDETWADNYGDGVLYKARAGGSFDYQGDDPTDYTDAFNQINAKGSYDLEPVMKLLKFVSTSSDQKFGSKLNSYLDVDSFAQYLAMQALLANSDAMDGPGNNYYLWYDTNSRQFTVLSWDLNLSFSGMSFGGAGRGMPDQGQTGQGQVGQGQVGQGQVGQGQAGEARPPGNGQFPGNGQPPAGGMPNGAGTNGGKGGGAGRGSGALKTRFMANKKFAQLYQQAYIKLYKQLYGSGTAESDLTKIAARAKAAGDTGAAGQAQQISQQLQQTAETPQT